MKNKKLTYILAAAIIVGGFLISSVLSNQKESLHRTAVLSTNDQIKAIAVENKDIVKTIKTSGRLNALNKIELYAEVSGLLESSSINFKEGNFFKKGQPIVQIDDDVYRNNLLAQKSSLLNQMTILLPDLKIDFPQTYQKWERYLAAFDFDNPLAQLPATNSDQEKYYIASRNIYNLFYTVKSMEATFDKYTIRAPFDGVVTESNLNPGTLVRGGQKLGEFTNSSLLELELAVSLSDVDYLKIGSEILLTSEDVNGVFSGKLARINNSIDQSSETVKVFVQTRDNRLKDGMYLTAKIEISGLKNVAELPRQVLHNRNQVFVINENRLDLQSVEIIDDHNNSVFIKGLSDGALVLSENLDTAYDGMELNKTVIN